jgi:ubiquinone/menaquinone biosynthesis C-methylase UbiE
MKIKTLVGRCLPEPLKARLRPFAYSKAELLKQKHDAEFNFWRQWVKDHGSEPETDYYRKFMMDMGGVREQSLFDGLFCVDVGCGPKGSMTWLTNAKAAIGVDPLAERYMELGCAKHPMIYLHAPVERLPFPTAYVDVVFSMNSLDHVDDFPAACREIRRVLKPGGWFIGSLNLEEPATVCEPWTLTEEILNKELFAGWIREHHEVRPKLHAEGYFASYRYFYEACPEELRNAPGPKALWCRYRVP